jgi:hypothetical protein
MITAGSVRRETAAERFEFLAARYSGRRSAIKEFTHSYPEYVFWIFPDGRLLDAGQSHRRNPPRDYTWILEDEPDYGGFLRGRVARRADQQLIVVYCRPESLASPGPAITQLLRGLDQVPIRLEEDTLVISDNGDLYGTLTDLRQRTHEA